MWRHGVLPSKVLSCGQDTYVSARLEPVITATARCDAGGPAYGRAKDSAASTVVDFECCQAEVVAYLGLRFTNRARQI